MPEVEQRPEPGRRLAGSPDLAAVVSSVCRATPARKAASTSSASETVRSRNSAAPGSPSSALHSPGAARPEQDLGTLFERAQSGKAGDLRLDVGVVELGEGPAPPERERRVGLGEPPRWPLLTKRCGPRAEG